MRIVLYTIYIMENPLYGAVIELLTTRKKLKNVLSERQYVIKKMQYNFIY